MNEYLCSCAISRTSFECDCKDRTGIDMKTKKDMERYLFIKLNWALQITNTKHYLTKWVMDYRSLDEGKSVTIRIFHKGNDYCPSLNWTRLPCDVSTLGPDVLSQFVYLQNWTDIRFIFFTSQWKKKLKLLWRLKIDSGLHLELQLQNVQSHLQCHMRSLHNLTISSCI